MSDSDLVRLALAGQNSAYAELVRRWSARVLALCHARVHHFQAAEDLAQETLLRGFRGLATLVDPERFGSWLSGIAIRTCLDWLKAKERTQVTFSTLAQDGRLDGILSRPTSPELNHHDTERLWIEIASLPEPYREVLLLYYYDDVTYQDLATLLDVSTATINARLTKARQMLRTRLEEKTAR